MSVTLPGDGTVVATANVGGAEQQIVQVSSLPAVTGTVALDAGSLAALETISVANFPATQPVSGTVAVSNFTDVGLTDAQLRAAPVPIASTAAQVVDSVATGTSMYVSGLRQDADTSPVSATGDVHPFVFDEVGRLKVAAQPGQQPAVTGNITSAASTVRTNVQTSKR